MENQSVARRCELLEYPFSWCGHHCCWYSRAKRGMRMVLMLSKEGLGSLSVLQSGSLLILKKKCWGTVKHYKPFWKHSCILVLWDLSKRIWQLQIILFLGVIVWMHVISWGDADPMVSPKWHAPVACRVPTRPGKPRNFRRHFPVRENEDFDEFLEKSGKIEKKNDLEKSGKKWENGLEKLGKMKYLACVVLITAKR